MKYKQTETDLKRTIKDYLAIRGIFSYPLTQGLGSYPGLPDRVMHIERHFPHEPTSRVVYIEVKRPKGKLSLAQEAFQEQCVGDRIDYWVIHDVDELITLLEEE